MPNDTPQVDWQNDPNFQALPLVEKHKALLQIDPNYKGLPAKEQAKALDAIHYGSLGQISGEGAFFKGSGTAAWNTLKGMAPDPTGGHPILSKEAWLGTGVKFKPEESGIAKMGQEASAEYQRARAAGTNPIAAGYSAAISGAGPLVGVSDLAQQEQAKQGEGGAIIGESAVPAGMALAAPLAGKMFPARGAAAPAESVGGISPEVTSAIGRQIGHATRIPGAGWLGESIGRRFGKVGAVTESPADIMAERQKRMAAYAEMNEDFANRAKQQAADLQKRVADAEKARQKEITDWAKLDKVNEADHAAFEDRMGEIESERQKALADMERFKEQHAASLNARKAAKTTTTAPQAERQGIPPPPPPAERPTVGSQVAAKNKSSILSRGSTLYQPGEEPNPLDPVHAKIINDLQTRSGAELRTMAKNGDRFAAFVLRNMPRPK